MPKLRVARDMIYPCEEGQEGEAAGMQADFSNTARNKA